MIPRIDERQIAIKLNEILIGSLDSLAKNGDMNRNHLMLSIVNTWLSVLEEAKEPGLFYIASLLRVRENQRKCKFSYEHEFTESCVPERALPMKFSESCIHSINAFANFNHISRHLLLKTMVIVGIEELDELTERKLYQFGTIEQALHHSFSTIMKKGLKAYNAYIK
jgi:metal-responsive CopG/Arc/MetJ family transcriptional regulator